MMKKYLFIGVSALFIACACVPARLLDESKAKLSECETERASIKKSAQENEAKVAELKEQMVKFEKENAGLKRDTSIIGSNYRNLVSKYDKLNQLNVQLNNLFSKLNYPVEKLGNLAEFKNGLNYSEKSTGDLVTIVGVKDFLEDFSPNLDKLVAVRIDGELSESYKLQPEDILVVRSNGSANLVGRFIYIDKLLKDTSYSGFTIRIRTNSKKINQKYLCYCLRTESVRDAITKDPKGANIKSVNQTMLSSISVPLPPIEEQLRIMDQAEKLEKEIALIEKQLSTIDQEKEQVLTKYLV